MHWTIDEHREDGSNFTAAYSVWDSQDEDYHEERIHFRNAIRQDAEVQGRQNSVDGMNWRLIRIN